MTTITGPHRVHHRPQGLDRLLVQFGLRLATWASSRADVRSVRNAHYREQVSRFERLRDRGIRSAGFSIG